MKSIGRNPKDASKRHSLLMYRRIFGSLNAARNSKIPRAQKESRIPSCEGIIFPNRRGPQGWGKQTGAQTNRRTNKRTYLRYVKFSASSHSRQAVRFSAPDEKKYKINLIGDGPKDGENPRFSAPKGVSLPVNVVVVIAMAVLVLAVIVLFFSSYSGQSTRSMSHAAAWSQGCMQAKVRGCTQEDFGMVSGSAGLKVSGYDPDGKDGDDTVLVACKNFFGDKDLTGDKCRTKCCGYAI